LSNEQDFRTVLFSLSDYVQILYILFSYQKFHTPNRYKT
jgi:hypothetical protein